MINILNSLKDMYKIYPDMEELIKDMENNIKEIQQDMEKLIKLNKRIPLGNGFIETCIQQIIKNSSENIMEKI